MPFEKPCHRCYYQKKRKKAWCRRKGQSSGLQPLKLLWSTTPLRSTFLEMPSCWLSLWQHLFLIKASTGISLWSTEQWTTHPGPLVDLSIWSGLWHVSSLQDTTPQLSRRTTFLLSNFHFTASVQGHPPPSSLPDVSRWYPSRLLRLSPGHISSSTISSSSPISTKHHIYKSVQLKSAGGTSLSKVMCE